MNTTQDGNLLIEVNKTGQFCDAMTFTIRPQSEKHWRKHDRIRPIVAQWCLDAVMKGHRVLHFESKKGFDRITKAELQAMIDDFLSKELTPR